MTTSETAATPDLAKLNANLERIEELSQRLVAAFGKKRDIDPSLRGPGQDLYAKAAASYMTDIMTNPSKLIEDQVAYWGKSLQHYIEAQEAFAGPETKAPDIPSADKRFSDPQWDTNPYFKFIKQQYLMNVEAIDKAVQGIDGLDAEDKKRLEFFSRQITNLFSPTNFLATNPTALSRAVETDGQSLVAGLENLVRDLEANNGDLVITLADQDAFQVGGNLATTKGSVVFRNRMFELIQYAPTTEKVHKTPLVIFPPWINKFYILDMKEKNSLIKWIVDQGYTLFVVSWINPDASYADAGMDTYVEEGYFAAIEQVKEITGEKKINTIGYCIAGTTLGLTLALMSKRKDTSIKSATFFTTMTDFSDPGEFGVFLDDGFVDGIEEEATKHGFLDSFFMSRTFSYLRSNDLIYNPAIRSYMMGEAPPAFDLLYWNGDGTNLAARMTVEYLRELCQKNRFAKGTFELFGEVLSLDDIKIPICAIACETDHIAAWKASYNGVRQMGSKDKTFILSESGHIAGIVNPPSKKKYGHYTNPDVGLAVDDWKEAAEFTNGSWWPTWEKWLKKHSGAMIPARAPRDHDRELLGDAPGTYVVAAPTP
ncbi:MAG: PHA/PHB synthase family protein [Paracoccaceae bacterium]